MNKCIQCSKINKTKYQKFCSYECVKINQTKSKSYNCTNCNKQFKRKPSEIKKSKNLFCSRSCSVSYNNKNKKYGIRRSKLEVWLESQLSLLYPEIEIHYNRKDTIDSELDIYIPSLNIAFELNGITHYKPIYGNEKFQKIKENDLNKLQKCKENNITLHSINVSKQKEVTNVNSLKYLQFIEKIIQLEFTLV